ncbi:MAG TPA: tetratricopeptide repeat protein, partial [Polyangium sp.]|nr:tetratricopeptide repeat protein [Polyangium sp.]
RAEKLKELARAVYHGAMQPEPTGRRVPKKIRQALIRGLLPKKEDRFASMEALLTALQIEPERNTRTWFVVATALLIGAVGIGLTFKTREDPGAVCRTSQQKLSGVWDGERKRVIEKAFLATNKPFAKDAYKNLERTLDDYAEKWVAMRTDACLATRVRGEQSAELFDLRMQCLNHHLTDLHALTDILVQGGADIVEKSGLASRALAGFEGCADVDVLRAVVPPPKDEATRGKVEAIRRQLAEARALEWAGRFKDEATIMDKLTADVGQIKYRPIEAEVYALAARARHGMGSFKEAQSLAMNAIFAAEAGRHDELAADVWIRLATWQSALEGDELERARSSTGHASALVERMGGHDTLRADLDTARGNVEYEAGNYEKAREYYQAALATRERLLGPETTEVARTLENLAMVARYQGRHEEALTYSKRALALLEKNVGPQHPLVSKALTTIGLTLEAKGEFAEARKVHERALGITEKTHGLEHNNMAIGLMNLANAVGELGEADEAITLYTRALRIQEKNFGVGHAKTSNILQNIGATLESEQRHQDALPYFERALAIQEKAKGRDYVELCLPLSNMGMTLFYLKRYDEALASFNRALELARKTHGDKHPYIADALFGVGTVYLEQRQAAKGLPLLEEALIMRTTLDEDPLLIANSRYQLGRAFWESGKDKPHGLELVRKALESLQGGNPRSKRTVDEIETWLRTHTTH